MSKKAQDFLSKKKEQAKGEVARRSKDSKGKATGPRKEIEAKKNNQDNSKMPEGLRKHLEKKGKR